MLRKPTPRFKTHRLKAGAGRANPQPDGLRYVGSWVTSDLRRCFQIMECDDPRLLERWMANWQDLSDFDVTPVITSAEAVAVIGPRL